MKKIVLGLMLGLMMFSLVSATDYSGDIYVSDTFADGANPDSTRSTATRIYAGTNPVGTDWRGFIKFDIPSGELSGVTDVTISLMISNPSEQDTTLYLYEVTDDWADYTLTYNNQPNVGSVVGSVPIQAWVTGWVTITIPVDDFLTQHNNGRGFALDTEDCTGCQATIKSTESETDKPRLSITADGGGGDGEEPPQGPCDYYVGDSSFDLPQINILGSYINDATHHTYLACLYSLDGVGDYEIMSLTDSCRQNPQSFNPSTEGTYTYDLSIAYMTREWNQGTHTWETVDSGTDNSLQHTFTVCSIPDDDTGFTGFIVWIQGLLCTLFGWFC